MTPRGVPRAGTALGAGVAAKEALIKASGDSTGFTWQDMVVVADASRRPSLRVSGVVERRLGELGVVTVHLSMSHDAGIASAFVVLEGP